jgi:hypothetical protein
VAKNETNPGKIKQLPASKRDILFPNFLDAMNGCKARKKSVIGKSLK